MLTLKCKHSSAHDLSILTDQTVSKCTVCLRTHDILNKTRRTPLHTPRTSPPLTNSAGVLVDLHTRVGCKPLHNFPTRPAASPPPSQRVSLSPSLHLILKRGSITLIENGNYTNQIILIHNFIYCQDVKMKCLSDSTN